MTWATPWIQKLQAGETVSFRPRGNSMTPKIESGDLVTVEPCTEPEVGDVVLCTVSGRDFLHNVRARSPDGRFQIANNHGFVNGWTRRVYGRVIEVCRD